MAGLISLVTLTLVVASRSIGIPSPDALNDYTLKGRLIASVGRWAGWRQKSFYSNGTVRMELLYRGSYADRKLVTGKFYDPDGHLRSRIVNGAGALTLFHENGALSMLEMYKDGVPNGPHLLWDTNCVLITYAHFDSQGATRMWPTSSFQKGSILEK